MHVVSDRFSIFMGYFLGTTGHASTTADLAIKGMPNLSVWECDRSEVSRTHIQETNQFGITDSPIIASLSSMDQFDSLLADTAAPTDRPVERMDARDLPPPKPLRNTLERLTELDDNVVLLQENDRAPQHLYPKLEDRGYRYETLAGDPVVTVIWRE